MTLRGLAPLVLAVVLGCLVPGAAWGAVSPVVSGSVSSNTDLSATVSVAVSGRYAYTTAYQAGELTAVDISNPAAPVVAGHSASVSSLFGGSNVTVSGGYAFVVSKNRNGPCLPGPAPACGSGSNDDGTGNSLTILDIHTDPANPAVVGTVHDPPGPGNRLFGAYGVAVSGSYAYVAYQGLLSGQPSTPDTSTGGFTVINIANLGGPAIVGNIDNDALPAPWTGKDILHHPTSVAVSGHDAFVTSFLSSRLTTIDISNPANPVIVSSLQDNANLFSAADIAVQGNDAYVADQAAGSAPQLTVVDVSDPTAAKVIGTLSSTALNGAYRIKVRGDFAYEAGNSAGTLAAIDISNPAAPRLAGFVYDPNRFNKTTGVDIDPTGSFAVGTSPYLPSETNKAIPPFTPNTGTVSVVNLDPAPIALTLASGGRPPTLTTQTSATFNFAANDAVSAVQCSLDGAALGPCTTTTPTRQPSQTTQTYTGLAPGAHTFVVQATGSTGATSTASYSWTVATAPAVSSAPSISGPPTQGVRLSAAARFSGVPAPSVRFQWQRCNARGVNCTAINGASGSGYTPIAVDVGHRLRVSATASNPIAAASAVSPATAVVVAAERIVATVAGAKTGRPHLRVALSINPGSRAFTKVTISLGAGLGFARLAALTHHLRVVDRHGHRLAFRAALKSGALVITLRKRQTAATVLVSAGGVTEPSRLRTKVRRRHRIRASAFLVVRDFTGQPARMTVALLVT